jgi:hypothetical protein
VIERIIFYLIGGAVALAMLASVLPKLIPAVSVLFVFFVIGRYVWARTR